MRLLNYSEHGSRPTGCREESLAGGTAGGHVRKSRISRINDWPGYPHAARTAALGSMAANNRLFECSLPQPLPMRLRSAQVSDTTMLYSTATAHPLLLSKLFNDCLSFPKAFLNWILFDEQFRYVSGSGSNNSGFQQVGNDTTLTVLTITGQIMSKSGYLFAYVSNETPNINVYFDNLQLTHMRGRILDETHYYPFGLAMTGISSQAAGKLTNNFRYNDKELQRSEFLNGASLEWYDYGARMYDPQIGRWHCQDAFASKYFSLTPYHYSANNPIIFYDLDGNILKDKDGNIITTENDKVDDAKNKSIIQGKEGKITVSYKYVNIYSDDGTEITVQQYTGAIYSTTDENGKSVDYDLMGNTKGKFGTDVGCNCHGLTFTDGNFYIDADGVNAILKGDNYKEVGDVKSADIGIVHFQEDKDGDFANWHSARKDGETTFTQKDDIGKKRVRLLTKFVIIIALPKTPLILQFHFSKSRHLIEELKQMQGVLVADCVLFPRMK